MDDRVNVPHTENKGVQSARTLGLNKSSGDLVTFVDADDVLEKETYELVVASFKKYNTDMVFFNNFEDISKIILRQEKLAHEPKEYYIEKGDLYDNYMAGHYMGGVVWNKVWKKEMLNDVSFRNDIQIAEDTVFVWDSLKNLNSAVYIDEKLYHYRLFLSSMSKGSSYIKFLKAIKAWSYLKVRAQKLNCDSIVNICANRARWILKALESIAQSNRGYKYREKLIEELNKESQYFSVLPRRHRISIKFLNISWKLFRLWIIFEYFALKTYIKIVSNKKICKIK